MLDLSIRKNGVLDIELSGYWEILASTTLKILSYCSLNDEEFAQPEVYNAICYILQNKWEEIDAKKWIGYAINTEIEAESDMSDVYLKAWKAVYKEDFDPAIWG